MSIRKRSDREYSAHLQGTLDLLILRTPVLVRPLQSIETTPRSVDLVCTKGTGPISAYKVSIIDEWLARRYWPGRSPLGQRMVNAVPDMDVREEDLHTVIGVVRAIKQRDLTAPERDHAGAYYFTYRQRPISDFAVVIRSAADPTTLTGPPIRLSWR